MYNLYLRLRIWPSVERNKIVLSINWKLRGQEKYHFPYQTQLYSICCLEVIYATFQRLQTILMKKNKINFNKEWLVWYEDRMIIVLRCLSIPFPCVLLKSVWKKNRQVQYRLLLIMLHLSYLVLSLWLCRDKKDLNYVVFGSFIQTYVMFCFQL